MKKLMIALAVMGISLGVSAGTVQLNGKEYVVVETDSNARNMSGEQMGVMVGDKVAVSAQSAPLTVTGSILVKASEANANQLAQKYGLDLVSYLDGVALLEATPGTNVAELEKALNQELDTPVNLELNPQNQRPQ
ncbi:hypothetical protein [Salinivibrio kushneri]|uniref:ASP external chaperone domain-containing protein n=1 Tax=Salinivibrio kushneri TaxID=1908198 RepID=A0AA47LRG6_9GAMM|nr:hypothetical protein [Salinivibrio kushneri]WBA08207.1 hypothetical protein N8M53_10315 [Salinivibrio kushneri]